MPITRCTYLYACIAIAGFPIANGFYSKDEILWKAFTCRHLALFGTPTPWLGPLIYVLGIVAATGTAFYMFRSYYMTFTGEYRGGAGHHDEHNEDPHSAVAAPTSHASSHAVHASDGAAHAHGHVAGAHGHDAHGHPTPAAHGHDAGHAAAHDDARTAPARRAPRRHAARVALDHHPRPVAPRHRLGPHALPRHPVRPGRTARRSSSTGSSRCCPAGSTFAEMPHVHRVRVPGARRPRRDGRLARRPRALQGREEHGAGAAQGALRRDLDGRLQQVLRGRALRARRRRARPSASPARSAGSTAPSSTAS